MPAPLEFTFFYNIPYSPSSGLTLHLIRPAGLSSPMPLVILVHGGGWAFGTKEDMVLTGLRLAALGYAVATVSYTFSNVAIFPKAIQDVKEAIRFLRSHADAYGLDPHRFAGLGESAGAHLISLAGVAEKDAGLDEGAWLDTSSALQAVVDICGPSNFPAVFEEIPLDDESRCGPFYRAFLVEPTESLNDPAVAQRLKLASPITHVTRNSPPFLLIHGQNDPIVPASQAQGFAAALQNAGVPCELLLYPDTEHGVLPQHYEKNIEAIARFLNAYLRY